VEILFGIMTRRAIRRGTFGSVRELVDALISTAGMLGTAPS
jgi:hypothetical protein